MAALTNTPTRPFVHKTGPDTPRDNRRLDEHDAFDETSARATHGRPNGAANEPGATAPNGTTLCFWDSFSKAKPLFNQFISNRRGDDESQQATCL